MPSASATEEPPYFCTTRPMMSECNGRVSVRPGRVRRARRPGATDRGRTTSTPATAAALLLRLRAGERMNQDTVHHDAEHQGIVAQGVRRSFGDVVAVDGLDLEAPPGEVTALVGPNGAGKTTLLLVLATLLVPDAGTVRIAGHDPVTEPRAVRARVGWMPDVFGTWETLTCREVLTTVGDAFRLPRAVSRPRIEELLALVHLSELADRPTQVLSRGQKQRLGLARALVHDPDVLLLDEPASGLDPRSRVELRGIVRELAARGKAVLVSSHVLAELDEMADRAVVVARGRTVAVEVLGAGSATPLAGSLPNDPSGQPAPDADSSGAGVPVPRRPRGW